MKLDAFTRAYVECAVWASTDDEGNSLEGSLSDEAIASMAHDCACFQMNYLEELNTVGSPEQHGHDFWLTRNRHGAGFWDRDYPKAIADTLTGGAHKFGECSLYLGDNGEIEVSS